MDPINNMAVSIINVSLEDEEEGGMDLGAQETLGNDQAISGFDARLRVVG